MSEIKFSIQLQSFHNRNDNKDNCDIIIGFK